MSGFPTTHRSVVEALRSDDAPTRARALDLVARVYRAPLITIVERRWALQRADAEDLAHDFLTQALEKEWLSRYDPARGRFRTFVRACLVAFAATRAESASRLKRGGGVVHVVIDDVALAHPASDAVDTLFEQEWTRSLLAEAIERLRLECANGSRALTCAVFMAHHIEGAEAERMPTYAELAERFGIPVTQVTNYLNWARRRFRAHVIATLRDVTASDDEFRAEAKALLGMDVP